LNAKNLRQLVEDIDAGAINLALKRAYICAVETGTMGEFLLRQALRPSKSLQIERQHLSDPHEREEIVLSSI